MVTFFRLSAFACALCGLLVLLPACSESPADGYDAFLRAALAGDKDEAWSRFSRDTRAMMSELAVMYAADGEGEGSAKDQLLSGTMVGQIKAIDRIEELERTDDSARLRLTDLGGETQEVHMRLEDGAWRIHLPESTGAAGAR